MAKVEIDINNVYQVRILLDDVIDIYSKAINTLKSTSIPYNFEKKYAYNNNYSNLKKDKSDLIELRDFVEKSVRDLNSIDSSLLKQSRNLPTSPIKEKDFLL